MSDARSVAIDRAATIALRPGDPVSGIVRTVQEAVLSTIDAEAARALRDLDRRYDEAVRGIRLGTHRAQAPDVAESAPRSRVGFDLTGVVLAAIAGAVAFGFGKYHGTPTYEIGVVAPTTAVLLVAALAAHVANALLGARPGSTAAAGRPLVGVTSLIALAVAVALPVRAGIDGVDPVQVWPASLAALVVAVGCAVLWATRAGAAREARLRRASDPERRADDAIALETAAARAEGRAIVQALPADAAAALRAAIAAAAAGIAARGVLDDGSVRRLRRGDWIDLRYDASR